ncbi:MAG: protein kinase family protein [Verrucomicrobiaceae bacterium]|nr:protein kinase family protein [Verrucomicrobiaceae bacterium]
MPEGQEVTVSKDAEGTPVLLRRLDLDASSSQEARQALCDAAHATVSFHHPRVLSVRDVRLDGDSLVFVQDYPLGPLLADSLKQGSRIPLPEALNSMRQFAEALDAAQAGGLTISQISPNEFVVSEPAAGETAGGLVYLCPPIPTGWWLEAEDPVFASPEQKAGQTCDIRSSLYSAGAVLGVMITGERPVDEDGWRNTLARANLPQKVNKALKAVLRAQPDQRCASPAAWIALLDEAIAAAQPPKPAPTPQPLPVPVREPAPKRTATPAAGRVPLAPSGVQMGEAIFISPAGGKSRRGLSPVLVVVGIVILAVAAWSLLPKKNPPPASPPAVSKEVPSVTAPPVPVAEPKEAVVTAASPPAPTPATVAPSPAMPPTVTQVDAPAVTVPAAVPPTPETKPEPAPKPVETPAPILVAEAKPVPAPEMATAEAKSEVMVEPLIKAVEIPTPPEVKPTPAPMPSAESAKVEDKPESIKKPAEMPAPPVVTEAGPRPATETAAASPAVTPASVPAPVPEVTPAKPASKEDLLKQASEASGTARSELYRQVLAVDAHNAQAIHGLVAAGLASPPADTKQRDELTLWANELVSANDPLGPHALGRLALLQAGDKKNPLGTIKNLTEAVAQLKQSLHAGYAGSYDPFIQACVDLHSAQLQNREKPKADRTSKALFDELARLPESVPVKASRAFAERLETDLKERATKGPPRMQEAFLKTVMQRLYAIAAKGGDDKAQAWVKTHR